MGLKTFLFLAVSFSSILHAIERGASVVLLNFPGFENLSIHEVESVEGDGIVTIERMEGMLWWKKRVSYQVPPEAYRKIVREWNGVTAESSVVVRGGSPVSSWYNGHHIYKVQAVCENGYVLIRSPSVNGTLSPFTHPPIGPDYAILAPEEYSVTTPPANGLEEGGPIAIVLGGALQRNMWTIRAFGLDGPVVVSNEFEWPYFRSGFMEEDWLRVITVPKGEYLTPISEWNGIKKGSSIRLNGESRLYEVERVFDNGFVAIIKKKSYLLYGPKGYERASPVSPDCAQRLGVETFLLHK